jgi:hypothetical protein
VRVYISISIERVILGMNATSRTMNCMTAIFEYLTKDIPKRLQIQKRLADPITKKYEEKRLEQRMSRGLANPFCSNNDGRDEYLCFCCF